MRVLACELGNVRVQVDRDVDVSFSDDAELHGDEVHVLAADSCDFNCPHSLKRGQEYFHMGLRLEISVVDHRVQVSSLCRPWLHAGEPRFAEWQRRIVFSEVPFGEPCKPHAQNRVVVELCGSGLRLSALCQEVSNVVLGELRCWAKGVLDVLDESKPLEDRLGSESPRLHFALPEAQQVFRRGGRPGLEHLTHLISEDHYPHYGAPRRKVAVIHNNRASSDTVGS